MKHKIYTLLALMLVLSACTTTTEPSKLQFTVAGADVERVWPALPEVPRFRYVGQLTGENNFVAKEVKRSRFGSFMRWLVGLGADETKENVLQRPQGIAVDSAGRIFVADVSRQAVFFFDVPNGQLQVLEWAQTGKRFIAPIGIALGDAEKGGILVADAELGGVFRLDAEGRPAGVIGVGILQRPTGVARDPKSGLIYVTDTRAHDVKVFNDQGNLVDTVGRRGAGPGEFNAPTHIAFVAGKLYVSDTLNSRIQVFDAAGHLLKLFGDRGLYVGNLNRPKGVTADDEGNIYIVESFRDHLLIFNADGRFLLPIGGTGKGVGEFFLPSGISVDRQNHIYVADMFNGRVVIFQYLGERE